MSRAAWHQGFGAHQSVWEGGEKTGESPHPSLLWETPSCIDYSVCILLLPCIANFNMSTTVTAHITFTDRTAVIQTSQARKQLRSVTKGLRAGLRLIPLGSLLQELQLFKFRARNANFSTPSLLHT